MGIKKELIQNKAFWGFLAVIIILPVVSLMNNDNAMNGHAIQNIAYMEAGDKLYLEVDDYGVKSITLTILENVKDAKIFSEEVEEVNFAFDGKVYSKFKVHSEDANKFSNLEFTLKIKDSDLDGINLNRDEVKLYFAGDELDTKLTEIKNGYVYYQASIDQMGEFVIGKAVVEEVKEAIVAKVIEQPLPEVQEPTPLPVEEEVEEEEKGFFAWLKGLFS